MDTTETLKRIGESLGSTAAVRSVFGEPIQVHGKTVIPVAKIAYGFGAGGGYRPGRHDDDSGGPIESAGGGGGVRAFPAGAIEITQMGTRFIPFINHRVTLVAFVAGVLVGGLFFRRPSRLVE